MTGAAAPRAVMPAAGSAPEAIAAAPPVRFKPMTPDDLPAVLAIEQASHAHPWTGGNFLDALRTGWHAQCLMAEDDLLGYFIAMPGVDEAHLLNLTVAPGWRGQGWARTMLDALALWARALAAHRLWLEVRASNARALRIYQRNGFAQAGLRKAYYPTHDGAREDAVVMSRPIP